MNVIVYTDGSGKTGILIPAPDMFDVNSQTRQVLAAQEIIFQTAEDVYDWIKAKDLPTDATNVLEIDDSLLPASRYFRDAWICDGIAVTVDPTIALAVKKQKLAAIAAPLSVQLGQRYIAALMINDTAAMITLSAQQVALNDIPTLEYPTDLTELENFMPQVLTDLLNEAVE